MANVLGCEGDHNCNCDGGCKLEVTCTACGHRFTGHMPNALKPGHIMAMGRAFQCTGCKRRGCCNGKKPGEKKE